jgi:hypothetical protein
MLRGDWLRWLCGWGKLPSSASSIGGLSSSSNDSRPMMYVLMAFHYCCGMNVENCNLLNYFGNTCIIRWVVFEGKSLVPV